MTPSTRGSISESHVVLVATLGLLAGIGGLVARQIWLETTAPERQPAETERQQGLSAEAGEEQQRALEETLSEVRAQLQRAEERADRLNSERLEAMARLELGVEEQREDLADCESENRALLARLEELAAGRNTDLRLRDVPAGGVSVAAIGEEASVLPPGLDPAEVAARLLHRIEVVDANVGLDYVVLDAGKEQGVRPGMRFSLIRDDLVVGRLRAIDVREDLTGAAIEDVAAGVRPAKGDRVVLGAGTE